jgi:hypothetical protein
VLVDDLVLIEEAMRGDHFGPPPATYGENSWESLRKIIEQFVTSFVETVSWENRPFAVFSKPAGSDAWSGLVCINFPGCSRSCWSRSILIGLIMANIHDLRPGHVALPSNAHPGPLFEGEYAPGTRAKL